MALNLLMLGPPGAGKGTQAERFARTRGIPKISTGEILRDAVHTGTDIGRRARAIMDRGELVNDEVMIGIVRLVQRADDDQAVVIERLKIYHRQSEPLVEYYRVRPTFRQIDGAQPPDKVASDLDAAIEAAGAGAVTLAKTVDRVLRRGVQP